MDWEQRANCVYVSLWAMRRRYEAFAGISFLRQPKRRSRKKQVYHQRAITCQQNAAEQAHRGPHHHNPPPAPSPNLFYLYFYLNIMYSQSMRAFVPFRLSASAEGFWGTKEMIITTKEDGEEEEEEGRSASLATFRGRLPPSIQNHTRAEEIFNFPTPVNTLFYLSRFDLQTGPELWPRGTRCTGATGWAVGGCFLFFFYFLLLEECCQVMEHASWPFVFKYLYVFKPHAGKGWSSLRPSEMELTGREEFKSK